MENEQQQKTKARAYEIWEAEGRPHDRAQAHWEQAEQEALSTTDTGDRAPVASMEEEVMTAASSPAPAAIAPKKSGRK